MKFLKQLGKGLKFTGLTVGKAVTSTTALEILGTLAKDNGEVPNEVIVGAKFALQALILWKMAQNNPDGTPATTPYVAKGEKKGN